jgi:hydroxyquinol 1,2-dioxygenase
LVTGTVSSTAGIPLAKATVDVWHADDRGYYDVQQFETTGLAGRPTFQTDTDGRFHFWSVHPKWYPIPDDGPVGDMLKATKRHPNRPAHVHFLIAAPGRESLITHVFASDSPYLDSDAVFGVKNSLIATFKELPAGLAPDGRTMTGPYRRLHYDFGLKPDTCSVAIR